MSDREFQAALLPAILKVGPEVYLASQLSEISSRFPAHVEELRAFLIKEKLPVPSPDAIPGLASRMEADARFRADVGSLLRAALYQERERIGHEDLLAILVTAAAGTKHDLKSEAQSAAIRQMLRFVMHSRRATFRVEPDENDSAEPEVREPVMAGVTAGRAEALALEPEPVLAGRVHSRLDAAAERAHARNARTESRAEPIFTAEPKKDELTLTEDSAAAAAGESRGPGDREPGDLVLPAFRTSGLFAVHTEPERAWWRAHPAWIAGVVCMVLGVGLGMVMHRVVSAAEMHVAAGVASGSSSNAKAAAPVTTAGTAGSSNVSIGANGSIAAAHSLNRDVARRGTGAGITEAPVGTVQTGSVDNGQAPLQPGVLEGRSTPPPVATTAATPGKSSAVPVTVVKQVVTASASGPQGGDATGGTQMTAATRSVVHPGSAGMTAANVIFSPAPEYPPAAAAARVHGQVTVHAVVDPDGNVIYARAVSGPPLLRDAAQEAVHKWRYSPLLDNGKPIAVTTVAILDFKVAK